MASDGFIREVDEELQRDRMAKLWQRYGPIAIGVALLVVGAVAGKVGWDAWQARQLEQHGAAFAAAEAALERNDLATAADQFANLATAQRGDAAALARLREAEARIAAGDNEGGLPLLDELASNNSIDAVLRGYAGVSAAQRRLGHVDPVDLQANLRAHMADNAPFRHSAREIAALAALEAGDAPTAIEALRQLEADVETPDDMRRRASELLAALGAADDETGSGSPATEEAS